MDKKEESAIEEEEEPWWKGPVKYIVGIFLVLIMVLWFIPAYSVRLDPEPREIPSIKGVLPTRIVVMNTTSINKKEDYGVFVKPSNPVIKSIATKIVSTACKRENIICHAKAIYYFVRDNLEYVADPVGLEYVEHPLQTINNGGGDCESGSIVLASLEEAIGVDSQLVLIRGHAYVRIRLEKAAKKYKIGDWIYLDWTCKDCDFGEIPWKNIGKKAIYLEVP
jgi:transglutaminase-like putative cysteine protease